MLDFPDNCIRGIQKIKYVHQDTDTVSSQLFLPNERTSKDRPDKGQETSINWEDNDTVLEFTLDSRDENDQTKLAFPHGAVRLPRHVIDKVINEANTINAITYERNKLPNNNFHGNIVFRAELPRHTITMIANVFALYCSKVLRK
jgi:hypothetical protein